MDLKKTENLINSSVRNLKEYHLQPNPYKIKLNQNESPYDWPEEIKQEFAQFCANRPWNRYPDFIPQNLKEALASFHGITPDSVIAGNGSNEMLLVLLLSLTDNNSTVVVCQPTFTVYQLLTNGMGRNLVTANLKSDLSYDLKGIQKALSENPKALCILCSPNNPTGSTLSEQELRTILADHQGMLILDQAYVEFGGFNALSLLKEYPNLIITRTFSKAFSGAGLRFGYMIGAPEILKHINKIKLPYNINFFSEKLVRMMLAKKEVIAERVEKIKEQKDRIISFLKTLPLENLYPSSANFMLFRTTRKEELLSFLKEREILLRDVSSYPMLQNCLRVNVGTEEENDILIQALSQFYSVKI